MRTSISHCEECGERCDWIGEPVIGYVCDECELAKMHDALEAYSDALDRKQEELEALGFAFDKLGRGWQADYKNLLIEHEHDIERLRAMRRLVDTIPANTPGMIKIVKQLKELCNE